MRSFISLSFSFSLFPCMMIRFCYYYVLLLLVIVIIIVIEIESERVKEKIQLLLTFVIINVVHWWWHHVVHVVDIEGCIYANVCILLYTPDTHTHTKKHAYSEKWFHSIQFIVCVCVFVIFKKNCFENQNWILFFLFSCCIIT